MHAAIPLSTIRVPHNGIPRYIRHASTPDIGNAAANAASEHGASSMCQATNTGAALSPLLGGSAVKGTPAAVPVIVFMLGPYEQQGNSRNRLRSGWSVWKELLPRAARARMRTCLVSRFRSSVSSGWSAKSCSREPKWACTVAFPDPVSSATAWRSSPSKPVRARTQSAESRTRSLVAALSSEGRTQFQTIPDSNTAQQIGNCTNQFRLPRPNVPPSAGSAGMIRSPGGVFRPAVWPSGW